MGPLPLVHEKVICLILTDYQLFRGVMMNNCFTGEKFAKRFFSLINMLKNIIG